MFRSILTFSCSRNSAEDSEPAPEHQSVLGASFLQVGWHSDDEVLFQGLAGDTRSGSQTLRSVQRSFRADLEIIHVAKKARVHS